MSSIRAGLIVLCSESLAKQIVEKFTPNDEVDDLIYVPIQAHFTTFLNFVKQKVKTSSRYKTIFKDSKQALHGKKQPSVEVHELSKHFLEKNWNQIQKFKDKVMLSIVHKVSESSIKSGYCNIDAVLTSGFGKIDSTDKTPTFTAFRESSEEGLQFDPGVEELFQHIECTQYYGTAYNNKQAKYFVVVQQCDDCEIKISVSAKGIPIISAKSKYISLSSITTPKKLTNVIVHPVAVLQILDHFSRRSETQNRVIGILLGTELFDQLEITSALPVPHKDTKENIAIDMEHFKTIIDLQGKVNSKQILVGWYVTGKGLAENDEILHELISSDGKTKNTYILVVDPLSPVNKLKAYKATSLTFGTGDAAISLGVQFDKLPVTYTAQNNELIALNALSDNSVLDVKEVAQVEKALTKLHSILEDVQKYASKCAVSISNVLFFLQNGENANKQIGRLLNETLNGLNQLNATALDKIFNESMQDMLMICYLSKLIKEQLQIAEKLHNQL